MRRTRRKRTGFDKKIARVEKEICRLAEHRRDLESAAWGAARKKERGDFIFFLVGLERTHRKLAMLEAELHSLEVRREKERALEERKVSGAASPKGVSQCNQANGSKSERWKKPMYRRPLNS